jgi:6-pyruvoyltetrahydropterin/6-carboxytetrahydropterin synthase
MFKSTKTYGNDRGLSCCFRQWRAKHSHCSLLHGYSIGIKLTFSSESLDACNWVMDFGGLKDFKAWADHMFDHTLIVAEDDPELYFFKDMYRRSGVPLAIGEKPEDFLPYKREGLCDLRIVPAVGCEMFAKLAFDEMNSLLKKKKNWGIVGSDTQLESVEVFEHGANSAIYINPDLFKRL